MDQSSANTIVQTSTGFLPFFLMLFFAGMASLVALALAVYVGPKKPSKEKQRVYECGIRPEEPVHQRLEIKFYRIGILFLIFGVEVIFFFPWALALANSGDKATRILALVDMLIFVLILLAGFVFAWAKGGFVWSRTNGKADRES